MAKATYAFSNFTAGRLSKRLGGRTDLSKYYNGCSELENFIVHSHGGVSRRPGTRFIAEVKSSSAKTRLVKFQFSVTQSYVLEFGNNYFRVFKDGGQITSGSPASPVEVTTTYTTAQLFDLKFAQSADVMYVVHNEHAVRKISRTSDTAWTITDVDFKRGPFLDPNSTTTTLTANARTGSSITISASAVTGINSGDGFQSTDVGRLVKLHHGFAKITAVTNTTTVTATAQDNEDFVAELEPVYAASTISFAEGDPDSTGLEHNDRIVDSAKKFIAEGFKDGMTVTISGTTSNNKDVLIVKVTEDTLVISPSDDLVAEAADSGHTISGKLEADDEWALGAFSTTTGFPSCVAFYEERLTFAATTTQPQTLFFSVGGSFEDFLAGDKDDSALIYTIGSNEINVIRYLSSSRSLLVGTQASEFAVRASGTDEPITPTNAQIKQQSAHGSTEVEPVKVGHTVLFVQRAGRKLRELTYNFGSDTYIAPDMTILAEDITETGIVDMTYQQEPDSVVWCALTDGRMACMTYQREEKVVGWHKHKIGGISGNCTVTVTDFANISIGTKLTLTKSDGTSVTFTSEAAGSSSPSSALGFRPLTNNDTTADNIQAAINAHADFTVANPAANVVTIYETTRAGAGFLSITSTDEVRLAVTDQSHALVESVVSIPSATEDEVYMIVQRTINGATKRYVEYLKNFDFGTDVSDAFFTDSGLSYSGSAATTLSGLSHLEGEPVVILEEGSTHPDRQVSSAAITLSRSTTKAHIGLKNESTLTTMRLEAGSTDGTAQGKIKRIDEVTVRFFRTVNALVGGSVAALDRIPFRSGADAMDVAIPLFDGDKEIEFPTGFDQDSFVVVRQDLPLPMTVIACFARVQTFD
jgi:hypothetical protein